jgi:predicted TIM-barrel fold metal-dependent hydrolase
MAITQVVDAHMHLWDINHTRYPWLMPPFDNNGPNGCVEAIASSYFFENYLTDAQEVAVKKAVHIEAGAHPQDALRETQWLQALADKNGFPQAIVAHAALNHPNIDELLEAQSEYRNLRGIRHILNWHPNPALSYTEKNALLDPALARGYGLLKKFNLSFDLQIYPAQMQQAYRLAKANPDIAVIINHMGMPVDRDKGEWQHGMALLSSLPHVAVKISGFGFINRQWSLTEMRTLVLQTVDWFGVDRVLFASNFPTDKLFNSFAQAFDAYKKIMETFTRCEQEAMFAVNAERIYRI